MDTSTPLTDEQLAAVEQTLHEHLGSGWTQEYVEGTADEPAYYRVATSAGTVVATVPDWAGSVALFLAEAQDYVPLLLGEIRRLKGALAEVASFCNLPGCGDDCPSVVATRALTAKP
jgi:hypothetical protein